MNRMYKIIKVTLLGIIVSVSMNIFNPNIVAAAETETAGVKKISSDTQTRMTVSGIGSVSVKPDIAHIFVNISTQNTDAKTAQSENNKKIKNIIENLRKQKIKDTDINMEGYSMFPFYKQINTDGVLNSVIDGYRASTTIKVSVRNLDNVGTTIDNAISSGATGIDSVQFGLEDTARYYGDALNLALKDAKNKASQLSYSIDNILEIEEQADFSPRNFMKRVGAESYAMGIADTMPVQVGNIDISARVRVIMLGSALIDEEPGKKK